MLQLELRVRVLELHVLLLQLRELLLQLRELLLQMLVRLLQVPMRGDVIPKQERILQPLHQLRDRQLLQVAHAVRLCERVAVRWNWHASPDDFNAFDHFYVRPDSAYISGAASYLLGRLRAYRGQYAEMALVHFDIRPRGREWIIWSAQERANWHYTTFPALVRSEFGYNLVTLDDGFVRMRTLVYVNPRCKRWHQRVCSARERNRSDVVRELLQHVALVLLACFNNNNDVLGRVLRRAHASLLEPVRYV